MPCSAGTLDTFVVRSSSAPAATSTAVTAAAAVTAPASAAAAARSAALGGSLSRKRTASGAPLPRALVATDVLNLALVPGGQHDDTSPGDVDGQDALEVEEVVMKEERSHAAEVRAAIGINALADLGCNTFPVW